MGSKAIWGRRGGKASSKTKKAEELFWKTANIGLDLSSHPNIAPDGPPLRLNPVENWFAKLQRHVIENGNFSSVKELESKMVDYIKFYNRCLVKPLKWKFKGFAKARLLENVNPQKLRA